MFILRNFKEENLNLKIKNIILLFEMVSHFINEIKIENFIFINHD